MTYVDWFPQLHLLCRGNNEAHIHQKHNCSHFAASNFEAVNCWGHDFHPRFLRADLLNPLLMGWAPPQSPTQACQTCHMVSHVSWSMKLLRPQSSRMIAFRMSNSPACPISPHGSFRESCHAMNSGPADTASATVAFCDPNAARLHKCTKLTLYSPMKESLLVFAGKNSHQHGWVSASHSWQFCDLCLTTISWDRLQELLFSPRRTRIQLGLTTKAATKPASYVGAVCWASKVSTAASTRRTTCVAKCVSRWQSASLETLASQKVYKRIQDKRYRKGMEGKSSKERVSLKQEGMSCKYSLQGLTTNTVTPRPHQFLFESPRFRSEWTADPASFPAIAWPRLQKNIQVNTCGNTISKSALKILTSNHLHPFSYSLSLRFLSPKDHMSEIAPQIARRQSQRFGWPERRYWKHQAGHWNHGKSIAIHIELNANVWNAWKGLETHYK